MVALDTYKKIPLGISNFEKIITENFLYVDKTKYIETLKNLQNQTQIFLRPRRFGKSLFLTMLQNYYDINRTDKFEKLFGELYIGKHPTPLRNSYMTLPLSFSGLNTDDRTELKSGFEGSIAISMREMINR